MKLPASFIVLILASSVVFGFHLRLGEQQTDMVARGILPLATDVETQLPLQVKQMAPLELARLVVSSIGVDAPVLTLGMDIAGVMETPDRPDNVAWYNFSAFPGHMGNAVFAGHVDFAGWGPAVFWHLQKLRPGDDIQVVLKTGEVLSYEVSTSQHFKTITAPVVNIAGPTAEEVITLITCAGRFNAATREYDEVLVVRARRLGQTAP